MSLLIEDLQMVKYIWLTCVSLEGHNEQRVHLEFSRKLGPVCFFIQNYLFIFQMFCFYESAARLL